MVDAALRAAAHEGAPAATSTSCGAASISPAASERIWLRASSAAYCTAMPIENVERLDVVDWS